MTPTNNSASQSNQTPLARRVIGGAGIGLLLISLYLLTVDEPEPAWGKFWMIRPIVLMIFAGAMGGLCNYLILLYHKQFGLSRTLALILSGLIFILGLYIGFVLGLDGTFWD
jgi:hypothetical protein